MAKEGATMSKSNSTNTTGEQGRTKSRELIYGGRRPPDYVLAHNRVAHHDRMPHGMSGFRRFWIPPEWIGKSFAKCKCGWRSDLGEHYRNRDASDLCFTIDEVMSWSGVGLAAGDRAFKRAYKNAVRRK